MRLFVAIEIPEPVCREVKRRIAGLRDRVPRARWVDPDVLHLTLVFLGEVAATPLAALAAALRDACAPLPPLALRLSGAGTFPPGRPARVAWLAGGAARQLAAVQAAAVAAAAATAGYQPEERPYHPHVTLARCPSPWPRPAVEKFVAALPGEIGPPFVATRAVLIESKLSPRGATYRLLADLPLTGSDEAGGDEARGEEARSLGSGSEESGSGGSGCEESGREESGREKSESEKSESEESESEESASQQSRSGAARGDAALSSQEEGQ